MRRAVRDRAGGRWTLGLSPGDAGPPSGWIDVNPKLGTGSATIQVSISPNAGTTGREAQIVVREDGTPMAFVDVKQTGKPSRRNTMASRGPGSEPAKGEPGPGGR
ncbi:hypothetical protein FBQ97_18580 [Acidobacteria bacterium ACD]|nr:MAG: hypothetical protein EDX89_08375 [Acidobacteriota bacterium]MCE7958322.1 hypothetical protein [Acidobacteria bacterium ACB2]MDL1951797.1 hypothetical protein [Acidobacteria bacterium ACD]